MVGQTEPVDWSLARLVALVTAPLVAGAALIDGPSAAELKPELTFARETVKGLATWGADTEVEHPLESGSRRPGQEAHRKARTALSLVMEQAFPLEYRDRNWGRLAALLHARWNLPLAVSRTSRDIIPATQKALGAKPLGYL